jgi:prevent-host-death family protein
MRTVSIRELQNDGEDMLDRVERGERLTVTRDGRPVAELSPIGRPHVDAPALLKRWARLPPVDTARFSADLDSVLDPSIW